MNEDKTQKTFRLTVEIEYPHSNLGYVISFSIPTDAAAPHELEEFENWQQEVREAVLRTGDQCLHPDLYTKKLAIAGLMQDLLDLNRRYSIQAGFVPEPAVQIYSADPFGQRMAIDFLDRDGRYRTEEGAAAAPRRQAPKVAAPRPKF